MKILNQASPGNQAAPQALSFRLVENKGAFGGYFIQTGFLLSGKFLVLDANHIQDRCAAEKALDELIAART